VRAARARAWPRRGEPPPSPPRRYRDLHGSSGPAPQSAVRRVREAAPRSGGGGPGGVATVRVDGDRPAHHMHRVGRHHLARAQDREEAASRIGTRSADLARDAATAPWARAASQAVSRTHEVAPLPSPRPPRTSSTSSTPARASRPGRHEAARSCPRKPLPDAGLGAERITSSPGPGTAHKARARHSGAEGEARSRRRRSLRERAISSRLAGFQPEERRRGAAPRAGPGGRASLEASLV
jgi:hypothetical protein